MQHPSKFTPVIISSSIIVLISLFPVLNLINLLCCAGIILGSLAGTWFYASQLNRIGEVIKYKDGFAIGILSGIISALIVVIGTTLISLIVSQNPIPEIYQIIESQGLTLPPEVEDFLRRISQEYADKGFSITLTLLTLIIDIVVYPIFSGIGGLIAVAVFSKRVNARQ
jgi:hypothetical protein